MKATSKTSSVNLSQQLLDLRKKIQNPDYLVFAVQRIAQVLSRRIVENTEKHLQRGLYESK